MGVGGSLLPSVPLVVVGLVLFGFGNGAVDVMMNVEGAAIEKQIDKTILPLFHAFFSFGTVIGAGLGRRGIASASRTSRAPRASWPSAHRHRLSSASRTSRRARVDDGPGRRGRPQACRGASACARPRGLARRRGCSSSASSCSAWPSPRAARTTGSHSASSRTTAPTTALGAAVLAVFSVSMTVVRMLGGPLVDRFGRVPTLRVLAATGSRRPAAVHPRAEHVPLVVRRRRAVGRRRLARLPARHVGRRRRPAPGAAARVSAAATIGYIAFLAGPPILGFISEQIGTAQHAVHPRRPDRGHPALASGCARADRRLDRRRRPSQA